MAYDQQLAERLSKIIEGRRDFYQQKMFGGLGVLLKGNMCFGIWKDMLILRMDRKQAAQALKDKNTKPFDITGKPMRGWIMVKPQGMKTKASLERWVKFSIDFVSSLPPK